MPKKILFSRELIIEKSFELFKEEGIDAITARNVAKILGCILNGVDGKKFY